MDNKYDPVMERIEYYSVQHHEPVTEDVIANFEQQIGRRLPPDYRAFLRKYGFTAGKPYTVYRNLDDASGSGGGLGVFYGLKPGDSRDLMSKLRTFAGRLPARLLPIASSPGGQVCLSLSGEDAGRVYWWEQNAPLDDPDENLIPVAHDFDSFMNSLVRYDKMP